MLLTIEALGKDPLKYVEFSIIPEVIHNATLVHDDIEDRSQTRRGAPAVHIKYGDDIAVNLGGYLYYFPMAALVSSKKLDRETKDRILMLYIQEMLRVHTGQATDIAWHNAMVSVDHITEDEYLQMVYNKSGVLARMACRLGAVLGGADERQEEVLGHLGAAIGVAFQLQDDLLNITTSKLSESKGGIGDDITEGKITLMVIRALQKASPQDKKRLVDILKMHTRDKALIHEAIEIIDKYDGRGYVERKRVALAKEAWAEANKILKDSPAKARIGSLIDFLVIVRSS
jgi:geranylgeranyl pyrophosphate synthase